MGFSVYIYIYNILLENNTSDLEALKPKYALIHRATLTRKNPSTGIQSPSRLHAVLAKLRRQTQNSWNYSFPKP